MEKLSYGFQQPNNYNSDVPECSTNRTQFINEANKAPPSYEQATASDNTPVSVIDHTSPVSPISTEITPRRQRQPSRTQNPQNRQQNSTPISSNPQPLVIIQCKLVVV